MLHGFDGSPKLHHVTNRLGTGRARAVRKWGSVGILLHTKCDMYMQYCLSVLALKICRPVERSQVSRDVLQHRTSSFSRNAIVRINPHLITNQ